MGGKEDKVETKIKVGDYIALGGGGVALVTNVNGVTLTVCYSSQRTICDINGKHILFPYLPVDRSISIATLSACSPCNFATHHDYFTKLGYMWNDKIPFDVVATYANKLGQMGWLIGKGLAKKAREKKVVKGWVNVYMDGGCWINFNGGVFGTKEAAILNRNTNATIKTIGDPLYIEHEYET